MKNLNKLKKSFLALSVIITLSSLIGCNNNNNNSDVNETPTTEEPTLISNVTIVDDSSSSTTSSDNSISDFRLKWLDCSSNIDFMSEKDIINAYINLKIFEQEYRTFVYNTIDQGMKFYFPDKYVYKDSSRLDPNGTIDSLIINSSDQESLRNYFDVIYNNNYVKDILNEKGFNSYSEYLDSVVNETITEGFDKEIVKMYLSNFSVGEDGRPVFTDSEAIVNIDFLNSKIFLGTQIENYEFKIDAYNDNFIGGKE